VTPAQSSEFYIGVVLYNDMHLCMRIAIQMCWAIGYHHNHRHGRGMAHMMVVDVVLDRLVITMGKRITNAKARR